MFATQAKYIRHIKCASAFAQATDIIGIPAPIADIMRSFAVRSGDGELSKITALMPIPQDIKHLVSGESGKQFIDDEEGFVICVNDNEVSLYADTEAGIIAGSMTFLHHLNKDRILSFDLLWDYPYSRTRGVKLFIPGRDYIGFFKEFIDLMVFFRCNTMMLEIGGAMEYKRRPIINERWETYSAEMMEYSGKSNEIQEWTYPWYKNSIHSQNGNGSWLSQDELRDLADYCAARGVEVIPEVPCTSHCDYMVIPYPEIAERQNDPYPDTFCPSNPQSYEILFDILEEVIEVFKPRIINIGHDEYYSIGICDRCKDKDAADILADDIIKIHSFLKEKGVRTMIWSDKIMNVVRENGRGSGGAEIKMYKAWNPELEFQGIIPATWRAIYKIPKDILCLNWYWSYGEQYDSTYTDHGLDVVFGNFNGSGMEDYRGRCGSNVSGGIVSNWSETSEPYLKRNGVYFEMAYNNFLYWDAESSDSKFNAYVNAAFEALYAYKYRDIANAKPGTYIEITHSTTKSVPHEILADGNFIDDEKYIVGEYIISYEDGSTASLSVVLGDNIANDAREWAASEDEQAAEKTPDVGGGGEFNLRMTPGLRDIAYTTLPQPAEGKTVYTYIAKNPHPDKKIKSIRFELPEGADWTVTTEKIIVN